MKELFEFLSKLSDKDPLTILLVALIIVAAAGVVGGLVTFKLIQREKDRDDRDSKNDAQIAQKDSALITLANTLALQGARALDQGNTLNELLKRQSHSMEHQGDTLDDQQKSIKGVQLDINDLKHLGEGYRGRLADIATTAIVGQESILRQEKSVEELKSQTTKSIADIQDEIRSKFEEVKGVLDKLEDHILSFIKQSDDQAKSIDGMKDQLDKMVTAVTLMSDNMKPPIIVVPGDKNVE